MPEWLAPLAVQGGAVSVIGYLCYRLVVALLAQAKANADAWQRAAEASDKRADEMVRLNAEMLSALRDVEALVRALPSRKDTA